MHVTQNQGWVLPFMEPEELHLETDDFAGRKIICTELQWQDHVCGRRAHRYMEGCEQEVIDALRSPDHRIRYLLDDEQHPNRRAYYKLSWTKDYFTKNLSLNLRFGQ